MYRFEGLDAREGIMGKENLGVAHRSLQGRCEFPHSEKRANRMSESLAHLSKGRSRTEEMSYDGLGMNPGSVLPVLWIGPIIDAH